MIECCSINGASKIALNTHKKIITAINKYLISCTEGIWNQCNWLLHKRNINIISCTYPTWCSPNVWWPTRLGSRRSADGKSLRHAWARARQHRDERIPDSVDLTPVRDRDDPPGTSTLTVSPVSSRNHHRYPCKFESASRSSYGTPGWLLLSIRFVPDLWMLTILRNWTFWIFKTNH